MIGWLVFVGLMVLAKGICEGFRLSEKEVIALLGTTTINIIGLFAVILKYLFPNNGKD